jgi:hypothetical protein
MSLLNFSRNFPKVVKSTQQRIETDTISILKLQSCIVELFSEWFEDLADPDEIFVENRIRLSDEDFFENDFLLFVEIDFELVDEICVQRFDQMLLDHFLDDFTQDDKTVEIV